MLYPELPFKWVGRQEERRTSLNSASLKASTFDRPSCQTSDNVTLGEQKERYSGE